MRMVTSWRMRSASPGHRRGTRIDDDADRSLGGHGRQRPGAFDCDVGQVDGLEVQLEGTRVGASQQQEVVDQRRHMADLDLDVVEGIPHVGDPLCLVPP